ncbi:GSCOCG00010612001-RA-CDS [Cotesia congregata]|nr:GSCOCG00010612001-RA-CDS [Cotesia congregata]
MRYRGPVWTKTETEALLNIIIKNNLLEKSSTSGQLSHALVKPLLSKGFERTAVQIRLKLRSLRLSYQKCKKKNCTPRAMKECPYYSLLDKIYAGEDAMFVKQEPHHVEPFEEPLSINAITNNTNIWIDQEIQTMLTIIDDMCLSNDLSLKGFANSALKLISNALEVSGIKRSANQVKVALTNLKKAYIKSRESLEAGSIEALTCPFYEYLEKFWGGEKLHRENTKKCEVERLPSIDDAINDVIVGKEIHSRHHGSNVIDLKNGLEHEENNFALDDNNFNLDGNNYSLNDDNNYTLDHTSYNVDNNYLLSDNNYPVESIESIDEEEEEVEDEEYLTADGSSAIVVDLCEDEIDQDNVYINGIEEHIISNGNDKLSNGDDRVDDTLEVLEDESVYNSNNNNNHHTSDVSDNSSNYTNNRHNNVNVNNRSRNNHVQTPVTMKRIVLWTEEEIVTMYNSIFELKLRTPLKTKVSLSNASKLIEPLARAGYTRSTQQIISKIKNMRTAYLRCIAQGCTPDAIRECPYFEYLDRLYEQHKKYPDDDDALAPPEPVSRRIDSDDTNGFINDKESESGDHSYNSAHIDNDDDNDADRKFKKPGQDVLWSPVESIVENDVNMRIDDQFESSAIEQTDEVLDQEHDQQEQQNYLDDGIMEHENIEIMDNCELNSSILTGMDSEVSLVQFVNNKIGESRPTDDVPKIISNIKKEAINSDEEVEATNDVSDSLNQEKIVNPDIILEHESGIVLTKDETANMIGNYNSMEYKPVQQMRIKTEVVQNNETPSQTEPQVREGSLTAAFMQSVVQQILKHEEKLQEQHHRWMERQFEIQRQHDRSQRELLLAELREFRKTIAHNNSNNNFLSDH